MVEWWEVGVVRGWSGERMEWWSDEGGVGRGWSGERVEW